MNIKRLFWAGAVAALFSLGAGAVPARQGLRTYTQPDGSQISLRLIGDEYFHSFVTVDGLVVTRDDNGNFRYRQADGSHGMVAHNPADRPAAENNYVTSLGGEISFSSLLKSRRSAITAARKARAPKKVGADNRQVPCVGSPRIPVLLLQYKDYKFKDSDPKKTFEDFFEGGAKSAHKYFSDQSNGKFTPQFDVYGPYTLQSNRSVYGGNDYYDNDKGVGKMVGEGCLGLDSGIDFSNYDNDGDGECDVVIVLYAGDGEASSYDDDAENAVWPCQWDLADSDYGRSLTLDGTIVNKFAVFNELNGADLSRIDGVGTFCHEFSHCIDLPDFYDTEYNGHYGMGAWSVMDYGPYNDDGYTPVGYSAYEKEFMGWIDIEEAAENKLYTLPVFNSGNIASDKAVRLTNPADKNEYYIIENRKRQGWDEYMRADGLLIYHVTYSASAWANNEVNNYTMQRMTPVPADNELKQNRYSVGGKTYYELDEASMAGDLWPYAGNNELTDNSVPAAKVNTGKSLGKPVTEMKKNADGTISFWTMKAPKEAVGAPSALQHTVESATSATISWLPGDSKDVTYTLEVSEHRDITYNLLSAYDFTDKEYHGWTKSGYTNPEADGIRFASNKQTGSLTSPDFKSEQSAVTVVVGLRQYNDSENTAKISILSGGVTVLKSETVTCGPSVEKYAVVFKDVPAGSFSVKVEALGQKKRFYLASADIYDGDASEVLGAVVSYAAAETGDDVRRVIEGISGTSYTVAGLKENGSYDYRVKAVPADAENYAESAWVRGSVIELSDATSVGAGPEAVMEAAPEYFTLQGVRVSEADMQSGVYIRVINGKAEKIVR